MNAQTKKVEVNETSGMKRVDTVDYRSSPGQVVEVRKVEIMHEPHVSDASKSENSGGVLSGAATAAFSTLQSAKDALSQK
ncbi:hypothetical protein QN277_027911 [Acacia crassicarpa]|uniref:Uncharacterized protein n=1 Tax=Acacia crassicarpa TaxID=499986 RepID=A0AAE1K2Q0_9FABA|nr:hypothetical protein QN277_027911 [Acacia crassicarpa]